MNSQNILKFWGSKLDLKLDTSEFYDYEIHKTDLDYNDDVLDVDTPITYTSLAISTTGLEDTDCNRNTISLTEYDNRINDSEYAYSAFTWTLEYSGFTNQLNNSDLILENDVYSFTDINNNNHYFIIDGYNDDLSNPFSLSLSGFTGFTGYSKSCILKLSDNTYCCPQDSISNAKPWAYQINHGGGVDLCSYDISRRTEKGWTLDFVFNKDGFDWQDGNVFYYWGTRGENDIANYADNNLSFSFTDDGRIQWKAIHYSGQCYSDTYSEDFYTASGQTPILCSSGTSNDFNITITFDRYYHYTECDLKNEGGWNDLITGRTLLTTTADWLSGTTLEYEDTEILNEKWYNERNKRLGILKIYLNGNPIYKLTDWEEVIPSTRGIQPFIQSWGSGTEGSGGIHNLGISCFNFKRIKYFEEPLDFVHVKHHYLSSTKPIFDIVECNFDEICIDSVTGLVITPTPTSVTPTPTPTISLTPTNTPTPTMWLSPTPTPSNTPTNTPTPTPTNTPSSTPAPIYYAYLFIEPADKILQIATYMLSKGHTWGGFNLGVPNSVQATFNNQFNDYISYSGWTSGGLPAIRTQLIPQTDGGIDSFGNAIEIYNFTTHEVPANTITGDAWYTWIIPNIGINNLKQTQIGFNFSSGPNSLTTAFMDSIIYNLTVNYTGSSIPTGDYSVYTTKPSTVFRTDNLDNIYFKGMRVN